MSGRREAAAPVWRVAVEVADGHAVAFEAAFETEGTAVSAFEAMPGGAWRIEALSSARPDRPALETRLAVVAAALGVAAPELVVDRLPETDWLAATRNAFPPIRAGRYYLHGSHLPAAADDAIDLIIDAGAAFGSGEHPTTRGCLLALDALARGPRRRRVLDMGCGSGILAVAAAKTWRATVLAADLDARAVRTARENARVNRVASLVCVVVSNGYRNIALRRARPYDLVLANILAGPLIRMAPALARRLAPGGVAVLAGLLDRQEHAVLAAHRARGLVLIRRWAIDGWHTLMIARRRSRRRKPGALRRR
ncbi:MAG: 50S ribosomal protein L11 methyltransferase [Alphaproteobacteria bacterium]